MMHRPAPIFRHHFCLVFFLLLGLFSLAPRTARPEPLPVTEVASGVFVHVGLHEDVDPKNLGDIANIGFVVGEKGVAIVDTGDSFRLGQRLREAVREATQRPILFVINTHVHPDHILGNAAFKKDEPEFIGHEKMADAMLDKGLFYIDGLKKILGEEEVEGTEIVLPTRGVKVGETFRIDLGGRVLALAAHPTAHTNNDLTVFDSKAGVLWTGDLVFVERVPAIDGSLPGWVKVLEEMRNLEARLAIPGHGPAIADWPAAMEPEMRYFNVLLKEIRAIIANGGSIETAVETVGREEKEKWVLFDAYNPRNVTASFVELEWE